MKFAKPAWVTHEASNTGNRAKIYTVHVHPDGSRIATGGLDQKINIWSTKPILNEASDTANRIPKKLCTLTSHAGAVLSVRWAHSGKWLASGSDDQIVMIWDLDPSGRSCKVWGSDVVNVEGWKPLKRLPGHESDVVDLAWSPGDRFLASTGLDTNVMIWCGFTLERLHKLESHQGFVKGVCWDPVGEFLATESDDKTVKIWNTTTWTLTTEITKPFVDSPTSTFFRRLSWSPDGAHITAANATNSNGLVFIAAVITRSQWSSEISLVGHENAVQVAAYNPHIFLRDPEKPLATSNICSVVALGADDNSVSIWQTKAPRPLVVAKEVFDRAIMDLSWSLDGLVLYAASEDGTIGVFIFEPEEMEGLAPHEAQEEYLKKYPHKMPPLPEGFSHHAQSAAHLQPAEVVPGDQSGFVNPSQPTAAGPEKVNILQAKRGKKRATLTSASVPSAAVVAPAPAPVVDLPPVPGPSKQRVMIGPTSSRAPSPPPAPPVFDVDMESYDNADMDVPVASMGNGKGKRKASDAPVDDARVSKMRSMGSREKVSVVKQLEGGGGDGMVLQQQQYQHALPMLSLMNYLSTKVEGNADDTFEVRNRSGENLDINEVAYLVRTKTTWLDFVPSPVVALAATSSFCAVSLQDGSVNVYSQNGRRIMPTLSLGSPAAFMDATKNALMIITTSGQLYSFNVKKTSAPFPPISVLSLLSSSPNCTILSATVRPNGIPIIHCSTDITHSYDPLLSSWVKVSEQWWSKGSDVWSARPRTNAGVGVIATLESNIVVQNQKSSSSELKEAETTRPQWWDTAFTLGHLESRMHAAKLLDSAQEYKTAVLVYAQKIGVEGFKGKAEELVKELMGPVYWRQGMDETAWNPVVLGYQKRDILKDVLSTLAKSKLLTKFASDWQDTLKQVTNTKDD